MGRLRHVAATSPPLPQMLLNPLPSTVELIRHLSRVQILKVLFPTLAFFEVLLHGFLSLYVLHKYGEGEVLRI